MGKSRSPAAAGSSHTDAGHVRDVKVERIGPVTIYRRGSCYYLYFRENGSTKRPRIDGNLAVARATAADVIKALAEERASPFSFRRASPDELVKDYLNYVEVVQKRAWRTRQRYRAALERFQEFTRDRGIGSVDRFAAENVEEFIGWLRGQTRCRNGASTGKREVYKSGGIRFILSTCRTAFNWAARNRRLPPYSRNPFAEFPVDALADDDGEGEREVFTPAQEHAFFTACNPWQRSLFVPLAGYGLRVGELTHLLVENVDFVEGLLHIQSKPELCWKVKTKESRKLPLTGPMADLLRQLIGNRSAGFVFLNEPFFLGRKRPAHPFASDRNFRRHLAEMQESSADATEAERRRAVTTVCRGMGQIPPKRPRTELMKLTKKIGCPEFTRAHDLRHLFSTRSQATGGNPLLIQQITGHRSTEMLARYTHFDNDAKRAALESFHGRFCVKSGEEAADESTD